MTGTELLLSAGSLVLAVLTYFAGVQRGQRERAEDAAERSRQEAERSREAAQTRVAQVANTYLANTIEIANMAGALRAGVTALETWQEVRDFCDRVDAAGESPVIPRPYRRELQDEHLLIFFRELPQVTGWQSDDRKIYELAARLKGQSGPAA